MWPALLFLLLTSAVPQFCDFDPPSSCVFGSKIPIRDLPRMNSTQNWDSFYPLSPCSHLGTKSKSTSYLWGKLPPPLSVLTSCMIGPSQGDVVGSYLPSMKWGGTRSEGEAAEALLRLETATPLAAKLDAMTRRLW